MGGRLRSFAGEWRGITSDRWILSTLFEGYRLEFTTPPVRGSSIRFRATPLPRDPARVGALDAEIATLLRKKAIAPLGAQESPQFMATFFLTPKRGGSWRPILNLRPLNKFIRPPRFRMETLAVILANLQPGMWATSVDLADAYLHIPVHRGDSQFLCFRYRGRSFRFTCLPFGLSTAPRTFTRITRAMVAHLRRRGVRIFTYLDDWLIVADSRQEVLRSTTATTETAERLGWLINHAKSDLAPSQQITYLGALINLREGWARPTQTRVEALWAGLTLLRSGPQSARAWLVLLGVMASLVDLVPDCRLFMRPLQLHLLAFFRPSSRDLSVLIPSAPHLESVFRWWRNGSNVLAGVRFPPSRPTFCLTSDASLEGWGAHADGSAFAHVWEPALHGTHINVLELLAVFRALRFLDTRVAGRTVLVRCDSTAAVSYINRQGGTRSLSLWSVTWDLFQWCRVRRVTLQAIHLPGTENSIADALSRISQSPTEWSLDRSVAEAIFASLHRPEVDLFASPANAKLPRFCSRVPVPGAWAVDALALDWAYVDGYAFPPFSLVGRVVDKVASAPCHVLLVAPFWPTQAWFRPLLALVAGVPLVLPLLPGLLRLPSGGSVHPHPEALHLVVWSLSGNPSDRRAFRRRLPRWRHRDGDLPRYACMIRDSDCTENGVRIDRFLRPVPLSGRWPTSSSTSSVSAVR